ncbi:MULTISPECIES: hypothetical protein [unclassified Saccharibacter]|uniref:hypothetical protein n=1 Tax=unclassified Saccharibacter TaxID=2648722 RepID=UPI001325C540|nr:MULTISPECIES: hypothetical protein [unclassified Saccharibacter]MXV35943.1 hypothetical protein [Saccharibacter sp. EH611]MXV58377.1 hypothetical protein [Saccharibacter sp. EH70]MXV65833.1 hypothetical protein [Saccharibacter sp. EH60]
MTRTIPRTWTAIAFYSPAENRFVALPNAVCTIEHAESSPAIRTRTVASSGREVVQVKERG